MVNRPSSLLVLAGALAPLIFSAPAAANGRLAGPANVRFHPNDPSRGMVGMTFGLIETSDGGATWRWVCEDAIGYGGEYDPDYAYHPTRDEIWATTFDGLRVSKDGGCSWESIGAPLGDGLWIGEVEIDTDGRIWVATSSGTDANDVFTSDDGVTFTSVGLVTPFGWWESIKIAPSDPSIIYVSGYQGERRDDNDVVITEEDGYLHRSTDGGQTWSAALPEDDLTFGMDPRMMILGVAPDDPDVVFLRVLNAVEPLGDAIYRSNDGGQNWTKVVQLNAPMRGFAISADGAKVFVGTAKLCADDDPALRKGCMVRSFDGGQTFEPAGYQPRLGPDNTPNTSNVLAFGLDGALYAGGSNGIDGWTLARSTDDGDSFTKVFALADIEGPLECPAGTIQNECAALQWGNLCVQNFICESDLPDAAPAAPDAGGGGGGGGGCCAVAPSRAAVLGGALVALATALAVGRRRRRPGDGRRG